jgi:hypothetical protein
VALAVAGCGGPSPARPEPPAPSELARRFDAATTGSIRGRLRWVGDVPEVPPFVSPPRPVAEPPREPKQSWDNPNAPQVDPRTRGVKDVAVFLRGVDPARARPWDHAPVSVELRGYHLHLRQGKQASRFGVVRQGDGVEMMSGDDGFYSLRARGAAFFTLSFPDPQRPLVRSLPHKGVVELSGGGGQFWMRAYLFVDDHPYHARTDTEGRFVLADVPDGAYELVCWLPSWRPERAERDPDSTLVARLAFRPPVEVVRRVAVRRRQAARADVAVSAGAFLR